MFTGLIEAVCSVKSVRQKQGGVLLAVDIGHLADGSRIGDSIAINGTCLTIAELDGRIACFDVSGETVAKSTLGGLKPASKVNAERAVKAADRLGGHFVTGHIDGTAAIRSIERQGQFADIKFTAPPELLEQMVPKGSVAADGISLTIADMDQSGFSVAIIPETWNKTTLSEKKIADTVNIETDIIVKTIKRQLEKILPKAEPLTVEKLKELGF